MRMAYFAYEQSEAEREREKKESKLICKEFHGKALFILSAIRSLKMSEICSGNRCPHESVASTRSTKSSGKNIFLIRILVYFITKNFPSILFVASEVYFHYFLSAISEN